MQMRFLFLSKSYVTSTGDLRPDFEQFSFWLQYANEIFVFRRTNSRLDVPSLKILPRTSPRPATVDSSAASPLARRHSEDRRRRRWWKAWELGGRADSPPRNSRTPIESEFGRKKPDRRREKRSCRHRRRAGFRPGALELYFKPDSSLSPTTFWAYFLIYLSEDR